MMINNRKTKRLKPPRVNCVILRIFGNRWLFNASGNTPFPYQLFQYPWIVKWFLLRLLILLICQAKFYIHVCFTIFHPYIFTTSYLPSVPAEQINHKTIPMAPCLHDSDRDPRRRHERHRYGSPSPWKQTALWHQRPLFHPWPPIRDTYQTWIFLLDKDEANQWEEKRIQNQNFGDFFFGGGVGGVGVEICTTQLNQSICFV